MLQRDDRPGSRGRPSLFSEAPGALGEDKNILKQLDGTLAAPAGGTPGRLRKRGIVGGVVVLCVVVAGLAWAFGRADRAPAALRAEALAPPQAAAPLVPAPAQVAEPAPSPVAVPAASFGAGAAASEAGSATLTPTTVTQPRAVGQPRGRPHRHAARTARGMPPAATERHEHKVKTRAAASAGQLAETRAKARGKDKFVAHAQHEPAGKRQDAHARKAASRGARGTTRDSDAALLEAVLVHGRASGAVNGKAAAGHCDPVKGSGAGRGRHSNSCSTHNARNTPG